MTANSIDEFLDSHRDDPIFVFCGKAAIAKAILNAEKNSALFVDPSNIYNSLDILKVADKWYGWLIRALTDQCTKEEAVLSAQKLTFVIFNYDRCIQHYLFYALRQRYFEISDEDVKKITGAITFIHPYGNLGAISTDSNSPTGGSYIGVPAHNTSLYGIAQSIRTFTEQLQSEETRPNIGTAIANSEALLFLGFGFHEQNLQLLKPLDPHIPSLVAGSACGISSENAEAIQQRLCEILTHDGKKLAPRSSASGERIVLKDNKCREFLDSIDRRILY